ncbi:unnamed protein product, partial [Cladocopium goreaui]
QLLAEILRRHQDSPYAFQNGLQGVATYAIFRESHPLTEPTDALETKGLGKELGTKEVSKLFLQRGFLPAFAVLSYTFPSIEEELQRLTVLPSGPDQRLATALFGASLKDRLRWLGSFLCTSPMAAYDLKTEADRRYAHTLFSLKDRSLNMIQASSAKLVYDTLMKTASDHRRHLVQDLRNGHLWDRRLPEEVPQPELRAALDAALRGPDGRRALEVEKLLKRGVGGAPAGAKDLWPHLQVVLVTTMNDEGKQDLGDLPVYSPLYTSSKALGHLGVNIFPEEPFGRWTYLLDPGSMFFELIPSNSSRGMASAIPAWEAEVGSRYELLVTSYSGLCRCRTGDTVRVHAMYGKMPVVSLEGSTIPFVLPMAGRRHQALNSQETAKKQHCVPQRLLCPGLSLDDLGLSSDSELTGDVHHQESENSDGDFKEFAKSLGVDAEDGDLLWVAKEAFEAPLPSGWSEHLDPEGRVYFFSQVTQQSSWSHPMVRPKGVFAAASDRRRQLISLFFLLVFLMIIFWMTIPLENWVAIIVL